MQVTNVFTPGQATYNCRNCKRLTRSVGDNGPLKLCEDCFELAGYDNLFSDGGGKPSDMKAAGAWLRSLATHVGTDRAAALFPRFAGELKAPTKAEITKLAEKAKPDPKPSPVKKHFKYYILVDSQVVYAVDAFNADEAVALSGYTGATAVRVSSYTGTAPLIAAQAELKAAEQDVDKAREALYEAQARLQKAHDRLRKAAAKPAKAADKAFAAKVLAKPAKGSPSPAMIAELRNVAAGTPGTDKVASCARMHLAMRGLIKGTVVTPAGKELL